MTKKQTQSIVPAETRLLGRLVFGCRPFWAGMGKAESFFYREKLDPIKIDRPVYIAGLARSGTTILLEMLAEHRQTSSHTYRDFPMLYTPCWWNWFQKTAGANRQDSQVMEERTHNDGIRVGPDSPEAMEEPLWMHFFNYLHDASVSNVLDEKTASEKFESFYRDQLRKILLLRGGSRYLAKGNYNLSRIKYLAKLFPDARFVIPARNPVAHIASLQKQQRLFEKLESEDLHVPQHMSRVGHFEFGLNWTPVNYGCWQTTEKIIKAWNSGHRIKAWALYWNDTYRYLIGRLRDDPDLRKAVLVVPYDSLCADSEKWVPAIFNHCALEAEPDLIGKYIGKLTPPDYYQPDFSDEELKIIRDITHSTAMDVGLFKGN